MSIEYLSGNKARLVVYSGTDLRGKAVRHKKTVTYKSKRDAERQYREFEHSVKSQNTPHSAVFLLDICNDYLESRKARGAKETTLYGYRHIIERIEKTLGNPKARNVTAADIDDWINRLSKDYSPKTIANTVSFLSSAYKRGAKLHGLSNPLEYAETPKREKSAPITLTYDTFYPFLSALNANFERDPDKTFACEIALLCGLRMSEILALRETDVTDVVRVSKSRHVISGNSYLQDTKTAASYRVIYAPKIIQEHAKELKRLHSENPCKPDSGLLILTPTGEPAKPTTIANWLRKFEIENGLPLVSPHKLRHTYASMLKWFGRDLMEISSQMGHADTTTTLNIYTHLFSDATSASRSIANSIDQFTLNSPHEK